MDIKLTSGKKEVPYGFKSSAGGFSQPVEPKKRNLGFLFFLPVALLIIVVLVYLGLWGYKLSLDSKNKALDKNIEELNSQRDLKLENEFITIKESIDNLKTLIKKRVYPVSFFNLFEQITLARVWFPNFSVDFKEGKIDGDIEANNYNTLAKQIIVFEQDGHIKKVEVSSVGLRDSGGVGAKIQIEFSPFSLTQ